MAIWSGQAAAQSVTPGFGAPLTPLDICGGNATFTVQLNGGVSTSGPLTITLPPGYVYNAGSHTVVSGGLAITQTAAGNNTAVLQISNIPSGTSSFTYTAYAGCGVISATGTNQVTYKLGSNPNVLSNPINAQSAKLNITSVTNDAYVANAPGEIYSRAITIANNGYGSLSQLSLTDTSGPGFGIGTTISATGATVSATRTWNGTDTVIVMTLNPSGGSFDPGETIVVTEQVKMVNCADAFTKYNAWFGCSGTPCTQNNVNSTATAGATLNAANQPGMLVYNVSNMDITCFGEANDRTIAVVNTGGGLLYSPGINMYATGISGSLTDQYVTWANNGGTGNLQLAFNTASFQYKLGSSGMLQPLTLDSTKTFDNPAVCFGANDAGCVYFTLPNIPAGDTVFVKFTNKNCCVSTCATGSTYSGSMLRYSYKNSCGAVVASAEAQWLRPPGWHGFQVNSDIPSTMIFTEPSYNLNYNVTWAQDVYPYGSTLTLEWQFPANIAFSGNAADYSFTGVNGTLLPPASFNYNTATRKLTVTYVTTAGVFNLNNFNAGNFKISGVAADCGSSGTGVIGMTATMSPAGCTTCTVNLGTCTSDPVNVICNSPCPNGGMAFMNYKVFRTNYGQPDNDNNRQADASGTIDYTRVRTNYFIYGDTMRTTFTGKVIITGTSPVFTNGYAETTPNQYPNIMETLYANVKIYRAGALLLTANNYPVTGTPATMVKVDFSPATLAANGHPGYSFVNNDSVIIENYYRIIAWTRDGTFGQSGIGAVTLNNKFYLSPMANPVNDADKYRCIGDLSGDMNLFPLTVWSNNSGRTNVFGQGCDTITLVSNNYFQIANNNTNARALNQFPYEYRRIALIDTISYNVPAGYTFTGATLNVPHHTGASPIAAVNNLIAITPVAPNASVLKFAIAPLYSSGGPLDFPFYEEDQDSYINVKFAPNCNAPAATSITSYFKYKPAPGFAVDTFPMAYFTNTVNYNINHAGGQLAVSSPNQNILVNGNTVSWEVQVSNTSTGIGLPNVWLAEALGVNDITITGVQTLSSSGGAVTGSVTNAGGIYQLGYFMPNTSAYYRVTATTGNCEVDNMTLASNYSCSAYPANIGDATCSSNLALPLTVSVQPTSVQTTIISQPSAAPKQLCDSLGYMVEVKNPALGTLKGSLKVRVQLPPGVNSGGVVFEPNSASIQVPNGSYPNGTFVALANSNVSAATVAGNNFIVFNIPVATLSQLATSQAFRLKFQVRTTACSFVSGSALKMRGEGVNACADPVVAGYQQAQPIRIIGAPDNPALFILHSTTDTVTACGSGALTTQYHFSMINNGPAATDSSYRFRITLPAPWQMNGAAALFTAPAGVVPVFVSQSGNVYTYKVGTGVAVGDSIVMNTALTVPAAQAASVPCGMSDNIREQATVRFTAQCITNLVICDSLESVIVEREETPVVVNRPSYTIAGVTADAVAAPGGNNNLAGMLTLTNSSSAYTSQNATIRAYQDVNGNGVQDTGDLLIGSQVFPLANQASQTLSYNITNTGNVQGNICPVVFTVQIGCSCDQPDTFYICSNIVLPVIFKEEQARANGCEVYLGWKYESGNMPVAAFLVQRSTTAATQWNTVATLPAGSTGYTDVVPAAGKWQYRIKAQTPDRTEQLSRVLPVTTHCEAVVMTVYPNPARDEITVNLTGYAGKANFTLTDKLGRTIKEGALNGNAKNGIRLNGIAAGVYSLRVLYGSEAHVQQIDIIK